MCPLTKFISDFKRSPSASQVWRGPNNPREVGASWKRARLSSRLRRAVWKLTALGGVGKGQEGASAARPSADSTWVRVRWDREARRERRLPCG